MMGAWADGPFGNLYRPDALVCKTILTELPELFKNLRHLKIKISPAHSNHLAKTHILAEIMATAKRLENMELFGWVIACGSQEISMIHHGIV